MSAEFEIQNRDSFQGHSNLLKQADDLTNLGTISNQPDTFLTER